MKNKQRFLDSREAKFRREIRRAISYGPFSKGERDVLKALVEHWFYHRTKSGGIVHPGREKLARATGLHVKTVSRALAAFRATGVIVAVARLGGLAGKATEYAVDIEALRATCLMDTDRWRASRPEWSTTEAAGASATVIRFPSRGAA